MDGQGQLSGHPPPEITLSLRSFALRVVSGLTRSAEDGQDAFRPELAEQVVGYARNGDQRCLSNLYAGLQRRRVTADDVMDVYLPHAVNVIGQAWHDEEIDILHASMACARIQNLLRELGRALVSDATGRVHDGRVLLTLPVEEQHTLGAMFAANRLRRRGVSVKVMLLPRMEELCETIERSRVHAVFISVSNEASLLPCARMVRSLRDAASRNISVVVGGGLVSSAIAGTDPTRIAEVTGADVVTNDIEHALHACGIQQLNVAAE